VLLLLHKASATTAIPLDATLNFTTTAGTDSSNRSRHNYQCQQQCYHSTTRPLAHIVHAHSQHAQLPMSPPVGYYNTHYVLILAVATFIVPQMLLDRLQACATVPGPPAACALAACFWLAKCSVILSLLPASTAHTAQCMLATAALSSSSQCLYTCCSAASTPLLAVAASSLLLWPLALVCEPWQRVCYGVVCDAVAVSVVVLLISACTILAAVKVFEATLMASRADVEPGSNTDSSTQWRQRSVLWSIPSCVVWCYQLY
jgi:hypothetical protein